MKDSLDLRQLISALPYRDVDKNLFIGMRCEARGVKGTIRKIIISLDGVKFRVDFDSDYVMLTSGTAVRSALIKWPDKIDMSDTQVLAIINSKPTTTLEDNYNNEMINSADNDAIIDRLITLREQRPEHDQLEEGDFDTFDCRDRIQAQIEERAEYNDSAAQANEEGWFYSDRDD